MAQGNSNKTNEVDANTITLGVLTAIEEDDRATQRAISEDLGIALGLTNAYLLAVRKERLCEGSPNSGEQVRLLPDAAGFR